jgi:Arc/MetJ-type ribon-helix-helix transcriptional regulator
MTKTITIRLSDPQGEALNELFKRLGIRGQRDRHLNAGMRWLADTYIDNENVVSTLLDIASRLLEDDYEEKEQHERTI